MRRGAQVRASNPADQALSADEARRVWQQDRDHVIHPWQNIPGFQSAGAWVMTAGQGVYVYDTAGRIRSGPAPANLVLPPYEFLTDTKIKIG